MKTLVSRKPPKDQREQAVLMGLIDLYLQTGKPVGSQTLRNHGFEFLSSATIRNYFSRLERSGFLKQQHSSGGRIPTSLSYQLYAETHLKSLDGEGGAHKKFYSILTQETREVTTYLQSCLEMISDATGCAAFLSSPRFDQDFIIDVRLVGVDTHRCLCVLLSEFGLIHTESLYTERKLGSFALKRVEMFFRWKLTNLDRPTLSPEEEAIANRFYSEVILRHIVASNHFSMEDVWKTGFSKLLAFNDFQDATALAEGLGLFEDKRALQHLLRECVSNGRLSCWVGGPLQGCSAVAVPYRINQTIVGAIAVLGPHRINYRKIFEILTVAAEAVSVSLTKSLYRFRISYRQPEKEPLHLLLENQHE